jgi:hypothetical protein
MLLLVSLTGKISEISALSIVPKLYREFRGQELLIQNHYRVSPCDKNR